MPVPKPPTSLDDSCTVIHGNTLYSFSNAGFLSIDLEEGAKWKTLKMGEKVTGATCVGTNPVDASQAGLFIVGGKADSEAYTGLQKFSYSTGEWATIKPTDMITKNRQWHGAAYLKSLDMIVIYAGNQDGIDAPSTSTFTIKASEPYDTESYDTSPPAAVSPTLFQWTDSDIAFIGGPNAEMWWFNPSSPWRRSPVNLVASLPDSPSVKSTLITGDDGSKSLLTFDLAQSPNKVTRIVLQDASGNQVSNAAPISSRDIDQGSVSDEKRDLTLSNWPKYNSTLAPKSTRNNFAMAQSTDGMVVFSGGNNDDPMAMFDVTRNRWMNATDFFTEQKFKVLAQPSSTSTKTTSTATSTSLDSTSTFVTSTTATSTSGSTTSAVAPPIASNDNNGIGSNAILGITLGTIAGFLALLGLILLCLRRRKSRQNRQNAAEGGLPGAPNAALEKEIGGPPISAFSPTSPGHFRGHNPTLSQESYSSMAILMGRMGQKPNLTRKGSNGTDRSSTSSLHKQFKSTISKPIQHLELHPALQSEDDKGVAFAPTVAEPRQRTRPLEGQDGMRRSSGWNRYWSGGSALQILGFGSSKRNTGVSEQSSRYSQATSNNVNPRVTQDSATVPPLNFEGRPAVNSVISGSPVVSQHTSKVPMTEGMTGKIERPVSAVSALSSTGYSSGIPESINEIWDPAGMNKPWGADRAPSSAYSSNVQYGTSLAPSAAGARTESKFLGVSTQPQLAMAATSSDMSWLNLGDQSRDHRKV